ncbi:MAG: glycosyltransferase family 4 protein [Stagnimonas sp.]|nr:glycosyltransferase family 4 protein [Stagnimonas sp.]
MPALRVGTGTDTFTVRLAEALREQGIEVSLQWFPASWEYLPWRGRVRPPPGCDLVHANTWHATAFAADLPLVTTVHICVHDPLLSAYRTGAQKVYHRCWIKAQEQAALQRSAAVTMVSRYTRARVIEAFGTFLEPKSQVIHNWVDTEVFTPSVSPRDEHRPFRLLFVGNPSLRKGFDLLPGLMRRLGDEFELLYTEGHADGPGQRMAPANMRAVPRLSDENLMAKLYRDCDALLFPSRLEGFGYATLEAQACGLPVIAFDTSSTPEIVINGETGMLLALDDVDGLERACRRLQADRPFRRRLSQAARQNAEAVFRKEDLVARYIEVYRKASRGQGQGDEQVS